MTAQFTPRAQAVIDDSDEYTAPIFRDLGYGEHRPNHTRWVDGVPIKAGAAAFSYPAAVSIDKVRFADIAARHLPGGMDPHNAWLFFQEASRTFLGKEIV
jgi:hypothetical protein